MYAARPEPRLGNGETFAFLSKKIFSGDTDIEIELAMPFRRMMIHDRNVADDIEPGRLEGHDNH